jgi:hypothetical protein
MPFVIHSFKSTMNHTFPGVMPIYNEGIKRMKMTISEKEDYDV